MPEQQGNKLFTDYDYDFGFLTSCLYIENDVLRLNIDKVREKEIKYSKK